MGYEDFEVYGFDNEKGTFYGYKAAELKKSWMICILHNQWALRIFTLSQ